MHHIRARLLNRQADDGANLLATKGDGRERADGESLVSVPVARTASRTVDHRDEDRHRLTGRAVKVRHDGATGAATLINLSEGGAMIEAGFEPQLWDRVDLELGEDGWVECAVCWLRDGRIGLEFAHETQIECTAETRDTILREVIGRDFADADQASVAPSGGAPVPDREESAEAEEFPEQRRAAPRHPLIWSGSIHYDYETVAVRLRNISETGTLIESSIAFPVGADLLLDLGEAGSFFATVGWSRDKHSGLRFHEPFDLALLGRARPEIAAATWVKPDYLKDSLAKSSPWASQWGRLGIDELHRTLR